MGVALLKGGWLLCFDVTRRWVFVEDEVGKGTRGGAAGVVGVRHEVDAYNFAGFFVGVKPFEIVVEAPFFVDPGV
jgi:hypothetical protein